MIQRLMASLRTSPHPFKSPDEITYSTTPHHASAMKLKDLFKVETLDTRFDSKDGGKPLPNAQPSKWNTPEYYIYYLFFLTIPPLMFKSVYDVSKPTHPGYQRYEHLLEPGWIPGRKVDNSDLQYRGFRDNIPYMALLLVLHPLLRKAHERFLSNNGSLEYANGTKDKHDSVASQAAGARLESRIRFDLAFATVFLFALHGISALKVFLILYINYQIATKLPSSYVSIATWAFNISILFANELCQGYRFADIAALLTSTGDKAQAGVNWPAWLDSYGGLIPRWEVFFKVTILRLIAFNFDYLWMKERRESSPVEVCSTLSSNHNHSIVIITQLTHFRRNPSTPPNSPNASASKPAPYPPTSPSATTSPTSSTPPSTSPGPC